jgi:hypothetical protein
LLSFLIAAVLTGITYILYSKVLGLFGIHV